MGFWDKKTNEEWNKGWSKILIDKEVPIPEAWRDKFYDELISEDVEYRQALEESIRKNGVRFV